MIHRGGGPGERYPSGKPSAWRRVARRNRDSDHERAAVGEDDKSFAAGERWRKR
jgi:hypothetical protein